MNDRARATYAHRGNLIGYNLFDCHNDRSKDIIRRLLSTGETNTYTVQKNGIKKLIFQTPWRDEAGNIAGLAELSIPLPTDLPHYNRDAQ